MSRKRIHGAEVGNEDRLPRRLKNKRERKETTTATKLDADMYKKFANIADYRDMTISQAVRQAIREWIERFDEARKPKRVA